jgi:acyl carrier protein
VPAGSGMTVAIESELAGVFREVLKRDVPSSQTDLLESGLLDSLALVELLFELEQRFGVALDLDGLEIETFRTLETIGEYVAEHQENHKPG